MNDLRTRRDILRAGVVAASGLGALAVLAACGAATAPALSAPAPSAPKPASASGNSNASTSAAAPAASAKPSASAAAKPAPSSPRTSIKVGVVGTGANQAPFYLADNLKAFDKYGVTATWQLIAGDIATNALIAKEVDVVLESPAPMITVDLNGGGDQVLIGSTLNHSTYALMVPPAINSAADLKGKIVGNDRPATAQDYNTQLVLKLAGVPATDITFQPLGGVSLLYPALISGQIQAAALAPPYIFQAQAKGFRVLATTYKESYQSNGIAVSKARIAELSGALPGVLAALRDGIRAFKGQPELAIKIIQQTSKEEDASILKQTYDFYVNDVTFQEDLQPTLPGIQSILDSLAPIVPPAKNAKPEQFVDTRFLDKLPA